MVQCCERAGLYHLPFGTPLLEARSKRPIGKGLGTSTEYRRGLTHLGKCSYCGLTIATRVNACSAELLASPQSLQHGSFFIISPGNMLHHHHMPPTVG